MRRRDKLADRTAGALPPELAVGRLIEVWSSHLPPTTADPTYDAWRNWSTARYALLGDYPNHAGGAPWSLADCDRKHGPAYADQRLRRAGVTRADIPALRRAAAARLADLAKAQR